MIAGSSDSPEASIRSIRALLTSDDDEHRREAVDKLSKFSPEIDGVVPIFLDALEHSDPVVVTYSIYYFARHRQFHEKVIPRLIILLADKRKGIPECAAYGLRVHQGSAKKAVPALIETMKSQDSGIRKSVIRALVEIDPEGDRTRKVVIAACSDASCVVRTEAAFRCWRQYRESNRALPILLDALRQDRVPIQTDACVYLGQMGPAAEKAIPTLLAAGKDAPPELRREVAKTLGLISSEPGTVMPFLSQLVAQDEAWDVRRESVLSILRFGIEAKPAIPALKRAVEDPHALVRIEAALALRTLTDQKRQAVKVLIQSLHDPDTLVRRYAVERLRELGKEAGESLPALAALLDGTSSPELRKTINVAIDHIKTSIQQK